MKRVTIPTETVEHHSAISHYYTFHSKIYDYTRWTFLFGRKRVLRSLELPTDEPIRILEVGCGTGSNLKHLAKQYPQARLIGLDLSVDMLAKASEKLSRFETGDGVKRIDLIQCAYGNDANTACGSGFDLILFSYCLTMVNPDWEKLIQQAKKDLKQGGVVAVVDFDRANLGFYKRFMERNHVRMSGHLKPVLEKLFSTRFFKSKRAYLGVWNYFLFIGKKV